METVMQSEQPLAKSERIRCTCQLTGAVLTGTLLAHGNGLTFLQIGPASDEFVVCLQDQYTTIERIEESNNGCA